MFCVGHNMIRLSQNQTCTYKIGSNEAEGYFFDIIDSLEEISRRENWSGPSEPGWLLSPLQIFDDTLTLFEPGRGQIMPTILLLTLPPPDFLAFLRLWNWSDYHGQFHIPISRRRSRLCCRFPAHKIWIGSLITKCTEQTTSVTVFQNEKYIFRNYRN